MKFMALYNYLSFNYMYWYLLIIILLTSRYNNTIVCSRCRTTTTSTTVYWGLNTVAYRYIPPLYPVVGYFRPCRLAPPEYCTYLPDRRLQVHLSRGQSATMLNRTRLPRGPTTADLESLANIIHFIGQYRDRRAPDEVDWVWTLECLELEDTTDVLTTQL